MPTRVKLPDGSIAEFPDGMSPQDIQGAIEQHTASQATPPPSQHPYLDAALNFGKGMVKSGIGLMSSADNAVAKIPVIGNLLTTPIGQTPNAANSARATAYAQQAATPHGTAQSVGKFAGNVAQFAIPGALERGGVEAIGALAPRAIPLAKAGMAALGAGTINAAQGGTFGAGALGGAIGSGVSQGIAGGLKAVAPIMAEKGIGTRATDRAFAKQIGQAIIDKTTGYTPGTVAQQATANIARDSSQLAADAAASTVPVPLDEARNVAGSALGEARLRNEDGTIKQMQSLQRQITTRPSPTTIQQPIAPAQTSGWGGLYAKNTATLAPVNVVPIPSSVSATEALALKRGVGALENFNQPTASDFTSGVYRNVYGALDKGIDAAVPTSAALNESMSNMIPVAKRAGATDLNESLAARVLSRAGARTGAGALGIAGGFEGRREGGTPGMIAGGLAGMVAPELLTHPTTLLTGARLAANPYLLTSATPYLTGSLLQAIQKQGSGQ